MFEIQNLKYEEVLDIPQLSIGEGITVIVGASGSGKTTLLRLLNKSISPTAGSIQYKGTELSQLSSVKLRREVLMLSQQPAIFKGDLRHNLEIGFKFQQRPLPTEAEMLDMLERVHLNKALDTPVDRLSGGEKQRLAIGRVFLLKPEVYLLDEPSSALDDATEESVISLVVEQARKGGQSIVMVTHSKAVAAQFADEIIEFDAGRAQVRGATS
ncbi:ABC transporter ATP-binding protein [Acidaminobacter hydrogenoformans]|uniref:Putative ABC transport system ATP-binding protein n=1 Tax=Acidaminobacter hydrogenoformans DSM 2784 TaxID=1120920 RepID=A0A1G5RX52_9FIRM|nr:ATP-binding cassette domain-containing protein [Acidaminobacter hydrogenoformans]SCZ78586.1 putative ABC transport system ATP-binding protein [Acidaminobacter hydrogenoformans DSM 2784]